MEDFHLYRMQPWFLHLQWKTCPWAEHSDDDDDDDDITQLTENYPSLKIYGIIKLNIFIFED